MNDMLHAQSSHFFLFVTSSLQPFALPYIHNQPRSIMKNGKKKKPTTSQRMKLISTGKITIKQTTKNIHTREEDNQPTNKKKD
jgi:hypothetical protein